MRTDQASPPVEISTPRTPLVPAPRSRTPWIVVAIVLALALVGAVTMAAIWRSDARDAERAREASVQEVALLTARVDQLEQQLGTEVPGLEGRLQAARDALREVRAELAAMVGPTLADGRHFARIVAVGDDQDPPRLIVDEQQWFTDQEAVDAALEDGVHPSEAGINGYYIRNENPRWRIVEVDPAAPVALTTYPHGQIDDPGIVDLPRFASLFTASDEYLKFSPYWITVRDGVVTRIEEQYLP
jgi:hypothetical protein